MGVVMSEQEYQAQVMDELKMRDLMGEEVRKAYIAGWEKGMQDAIEMVKLQGEKSE
jgi:hypothetical protein